MMNEAQVLKIVPVSRTTLYRMEKAGKFPRSTYISPNRRVWFEDEIIGWQRSVDEFNPNRGRGKGRRQTASTHNGVMSVSKHMGHHPSEWSMPYSRSALSRNMRSPAFDPPGTGGRLNVAGMMYGATPLM